MVSEIIQIDTEQVTRALEQQAEARKPEAKDKARTPLRPELRKALEESWERDEAAYRYLGR